MVDDGKGRDTDGRLGSSVGGSEVSENESGSNTNVGEEVLSLGLV